MFELEKHTATPLSKGLIPITNIKNEKIVQFYRSLLKKDIYFRNNQNNL